MAKAPLRPVDKAAYAIVRSYIAAGQAAWAFWDKNGGTWPNTNSTVGFEKMLKTILEYIPAMSITYGGEDNCPTEDERTWDSSCFALAYSNVFSPGNTQSMIAALDARTPPDVLDAFGEVPAGGGDLEFWATALAAGVLIAVGGLPFAGATVVRIVGYLFAAWASYKFVTPQTPGGQSIFEEWKDKLGEGLDSAIKGATSIIGLVIGGLIVYWLATTK